MKNNNNLMGINNNSLNSDKLLKNRYILYGGLAVFGFIVLIVIYLYNIEDKEANNIDPDSFSSWILNLYNIFDEPEPEPEPENNEFNNKLDESLKNSLNGDDPWLSRNK